jgi:hypothetical protein
MPTPLSLVLVFVVSFGGGRFGLVVVCDRLFVVQVVDKDLGKRNNKGG